MSTSDAFEERYNLLNSEQRRAVDTLDGSSRPCPFAHCECGLAAGRE